MDATLHVVEFEIELSYDVSFLEDWVVDVRENPAAQPGCIYQAPDRWPCEAVYGCSLCSSISARGAHEWYVVAARVCAGSLESSEPFEVSADGQRSRVDPRGTQFVDENGVTLRDCIDSEDLTPWEPDARVQLAVGNAETWITMECHDDRLCVIVVHVVSVTAYLCGLKRTRDQKLSSGLMSGQLSLAITGLMLLMFMTIHLFQLRFADTEQYFLRHLFNWRPS